MNEIKILCLTENVFDQQSMMRQRIDAIGIQTESLSYNPEPIARS